MWCLYGDEHVNPPSIVQGFPKLTLPLVLVPMRKALLSPAESGLWKDRYQTAQKESELRGREVPHAIHILLGILFRPQVIFRGCVQRTFQTMQTADLSYIVSLFLSLSLYASRVHPSHFAATHGYTMLVAIRHDD